MMQDLPHALFAGMIGYCNRVALAYVILVLFRGRQLFGKEGGNWWEKEHPSPREGVRRY